MRQSLIAAISAAVFTAVAIPALALADGNHPHHVHHGPRNVSPIQQQVAKLNKEVQQALQEIQTLSNQTVQQQNELSQEQNALAQDQQEIQNLSNTDRQQADQIANLQQAVNAQDQQLAALQNSINVFANEIQQLQSSGSQTVEIREMAANGQPVFVGLTLVPIHGGPSISYDPTDSSYNGTVAFPNVPSGTYDVVTAAPEYQVNQPKQIAVQNSGSTTLTLQLSTNIYTVSGTAETPSGSPVINAPISFSDPSGHSWSYGWHTDSNGTFAVDDLPPGTYTIHAGSLSADEATFTITNTNFNLGIIK